MTFGERIVFYRTQKGLNQKQFAQLLQITPTRLNYWEKDKRQPDVFMIKAISDALEISPDMLLGMVEDEENKNTPISEETGDDDSISVAEMRQLLLRLGYLTDGRDLTDKDVKFLSGIFDMLDAWFG